jgi:hypothetical protein
MARHRTSPAPAGARLLAALYLTAAAVGIVRGSPLQQVLAVLPLLVLLGIRSLRRQATRRRCTSADPPEGSER